MNVKYISEPNVLVDLRSKFPITRDQGRRPLCLVFAISDVNTFLHNETEEFSVEYLSHYAYKISGTTDYTQGLNFSSVQKALEDHGQPHESLAPYNESAKKPIIPTGTYSKLFFAKGKKLPDLVDDLIEELNKGNAVTIGVNLSSSFFSPTGAYVIDDENGNSGNHAVDVVGYGRYPDSEVCFLIRNSWGMDWANNGHAWLTSKFISNRAFMSLRLSKI